MIREPLIDYIKFVGHMFKIKDEYSIKAVAWGFKAGIMNGSGYTITDEREKEINKEITDTLKELGYE